jgi:hypothetical protein
MSRQATLASSRDSKPAFWGRAEELRWRSGPDVLSATTTAALSTFEHRPADLVAQALVVQDEFANRIRELFALPTALEPTSAVGLACGSRRTRSFDRVGRSTELVRGDMRYHRGLAGGECRVTGRSAQHSCRSHCMAARSAGLGHRDLASRPCPNLFDRLAGPGVRRLHRLEEAQNVLCARGRPPSQEPMVGVGECPPAADGDESGVAVLGQDHGSTVRRRCTIPRRCLGRLSRHAGGRSTRSGSDKLAHGTTLGTLDLEPTLGAAFVDGLC